MDYTRRKPTWSAHITALLAATLVTLPAQALHFYLDAGSSSPKCFYEELPKDTLVVGHYTATHHSAQSNNYESNPDLGITVTVDETFDNDHRVVSTKGSSQGTFTFTAADAGDHRICFTPSGGNTGGWFSGGAPHGNVKLNLDLAIGETNSINNGDKGKLSEIAQKVKDLNAKLQDIKREQIFQREREAEFRDQSESTNARVVRWTIIQIIVLVATCFWQLSHLRAFFIKQKLT